MDNTWKRKLKKGLLITNIQTYIKLYIKKLYKNILKIIINIRLLFKFIKLIDARRGI